MASTPETAVKTKIKKYLASEGIYYFCPIGGPYSVKGVPDIVCCVRGQFVGIEVKAPGKEKTLTHNQAMHISLIKGNGGVAFVASSLDDVIDQLTNHGLV